MLVIYVNCSYYEEYNSIKNKKNYLVFGVTVHLFSIKCREPSHGSCTDAMA